MENRREKHIICLFNKIINGYTPAYLSDLIPNQVHQQSSYQLRNQDNYTPFFARTNIFQNSFFPYAVRSWNLLNPNIRNIKDRELFKRELCRNDPKPNIIYTLGRRKAGVALSGIRMKCILSKEHLSALHILNDTQCQCGHDYEDELHYFFTCLMYQVRELSYMNKF